MPSIEQDTLETFPLKVLLMLARSLGLRKGRARGFACPTYGSPILSGQVEGIGRWSCAQEPSHRGTALELLMLKKGYSREQALVTLLWPPKRVRDR